jgi:hypothetical protein
MEPKLLKASQFHAKVSSQPQLTKHILAVVYNEAHAILEWGGLFHPDYRDAGGMLRGQLPAGIPVLAASAMVAPLLIELYCLLRYQLLLLGINLLLPELTSTTFSLVFSCSIIGLLLHWCHRLVCKFLALSKRWPVSFPLEWRAQDAHR